MSTFSFGNTVSQPAAQSGGSLFGTAKPAFSFGNTSTSASAPAAGGTSLFGNNNTTATNTNTGGTGGLFGSSNTTQPAAGSTGGLFGNLNNQQGQNQQPQQQQSGGLFGSLGQQPQQQQQQQQQPQQQSGGLFGNLGQQQPQQQQQQSGGLFGQTNQNTQTSGGLFGNTSTSQPGQTSSLFGSTAPKPAGGLFGNTSTTGGGSGGGLFGQTQTNQPQQQTSSLFGSTTAKPSFGLFGSTNQQSQLGASSAQQQQQQQAQPAVRSTLFESQSRPRNLFQVQNEKSIEERMLAVKNAWDPSHPECQFKYYFYNVVTPGTTGQYARPQGGPLAERYARAERENPDPNTMVPALATGWDDVKKRSDLQEQLAASHQVRMNDCAKSLQVISRQTSHDSTHRLQELQRRLAQLQQRLIRVAGESLSLNPHFSSSSYKPEEAQTKAKLVAVKDELDGNGKAVAAPAKSSYGLRDVTGTPTRRKNIGEGRMSGQVNELWGAIEDIRRRRKAQYAGGQEAWTTDEKALEAVAQILGQHQDALDKLRAMVDDNAFDVEVLDRGLKELGR